MQLRDIISWKKNSVVKEWFKQNGPILFIVLIGFIFRIWGFPHNIGWGNDIGRDFLAGHLIAFEGKNTLVGHFNSGIQTYYPSHYYYLLSFFTAILVRLEDIFFILILLHSLSIFIFYKAVVEYFPKRAALISALLFAMSPRIIDMAVIPLSAHFSMIPFVLSLFYFSKFLKTNKIVFLIASSFFLLFTSSVFYGAVLFIPFFVLAIALHFRYPKGVLYSLVFAFFSSLFFYTLFFQIIKIGALTKLLFLEIEPLAAKFSMEQFFLSAKNELGKYLLSSTKLAVMTFLVSLVAIKKNIRSMIFLVFVFFCMLLALSIISDPLSHYLILTAPLLFVVGGLTLHHLIESNKFLSILFLIVLTVSAGYYDPLKFVSPWPKYSTFQQLEVYLKNNYNTYNVVMSERTSPINWDSRALWYFQRNRKSFELSNTSSQIENYDSEIETIHICKYYGENEGLFCNDISEQNKLLFLEKQIIDNVYFDIYKQPPS